MNNHLIGKEISEAAKFLKWYILESQHYMGERKYKYTFFRAGVGRIELFCDNNIVISAR